MSFYIGVFNQDKAPRKRNDFINWFIEKTKWEEERDYGSPEGIEEKLSNFFLESIKIFPQMNGPYAPNDSEIDEYVDRHLVDYCMCEGLIYMSSEWSVAEELENFICEYAKKNKLGVIGFTFDGYIIKSFEYTLKEIYEKLNGKVSGDISYTEDMNNIPSITWKIDNHNSVHISDNLDIFVDIMTKTFFLKKQKRFYVEDFHSEEYSNSIYEEIIYIDEYYRKHGSLNNYNKK